MSFNSEITAAMSDVFDTLSETLGYERLTSRGTLNVSTGKATMTYATKIDVRGIPSQERTEMLDNSGIPAVVLDFAINASDVSNTILKEGDRISYKANFFTVVRADFQSDETVIVATCKRVKP